MLGMQSYARSGSFVTPPFLICFVTKHYCEKINFACKELMWPGPPPKGVSEYDVQFRCGTASWSSSTLLGSLLSTSTILTGLNASTESTLRVRAVSEIGDYYLSREYTTLISTSMHCYKYWFMQ